MRTREILRAARKDGQWAGKNAAGWAFDGNTDPATYKRVLAGIMDGDPEVLDSFRTPDLSGEWSGDPTPRSLANDYDLDDDDPRDWLLDEACTVWMDAASQAFWDEIERVCRLNSVED